VRVSVSEMAVSDVGRGVTRASNENGTPDCLHDTCFYILFQTWCSWTCSIFREQQSRFMEQGVVLGYSVVDLDRLLGRFAAGVLYVTGLRMISEAFEQALVKSPITLSSS